MIVGDCPYEDCGETQMRCLPDVALPVIGKDTCEHCGQTCFIIFSRADPQVWTVEAFLVEYDVDDNARTITPKVKGGHA